MEKSLALATIAVINGGSDGTQIIVTAHGVHKIGPWNPNILAAVKAEKYLTHVMNTTKDRAVKKNMSEALLNVSSSLMASMKENAGAFEFNGTTAFVTVDGDDIDWRCGNEPRPFPVPGPAQTIVLQH